MASTNATVPASPSPASLHIHFDNTLGAVFIGLIVSAILFGVTNVQALIYYQSSPRDPRYMKWTVGFLWVLDALHLALISHVLYFYLVTNFTNLLVITKPTWSLCLHVFVTTISDFIVRLYYTRRVWILSKHNKFLTLGAATFTVVTFVSGMGYGGKIFTYDSTREFSRISWLLYTVLGSSVAADMWVTISLCYFLSKNRSGFKSTDTKIKLLMVYIINTGLLTSVCAICCFVSFSVMPDNYVFIGFFFSLSKLYFNSLLATLNARDRLREDLGASLYGNSAWVGAGAYQMPRLVGVSSAASNLKCGASSFSRIGVGVGAAPGSGLERGEEISFGEKDTRELAVRVRTERDYHHVADEMETKPECFP